MALNPLPATSLRINVVLTGMSRDRATAGHEMLFRYVNGLSARGHEVRVVPTGPGARPAWFDLDADIVEPREPLFGVSLLRAVRRYAEFRSGAGDKSAARAAISDLTRRAAERSSLPYRRAAAIERLQRALPPADVTLATGAPTALPVYLYGTGARVYFMQGYETWFQVESEPKWQRLAEMDAELTYKLPLHRIANSTWLAQMVRERHGGDVELCLNALDHSIFHESEQALVPPLTVASYSGRGAALKGFADAAAAIQLARQKVGDLRWLVFGHPAELAPDNPIAPYESVGVVGGADLRDVYARAHITLCPAWHDSFPMYPMEAMACGSSVITTPLGVEDYAEHERNALIVPARNPQAMAEAIVRLHTDASLRSSLRAQGLVDVRRFTWDRSLDRMESLLCRFVERERMPERDDLHVTHELAAAV